MIRRSTATSRAYAAAAAPSFALLLAGLVGVLGLFGLLLAQDGLASNLATIASVAALTLLCGLHTRAAAALVLAPGRIRTAIRDRERRTAFLPQRDPDAAGRPRPRAPGRPPRTVTQALAPAH